MQRTAVGLRVIWALMLLRAVGAELLAGDASVQEARNALTQCLQSQRLADRVSMQVVTQIDLTPLDDRPRRQRAEFWFRRDGDLVDLSGRYFFLDKLQKASHRFRTVVGKDVYTTYSYWLSEKGPTSGLVSTQKAKEFARIANAFQNGMFLDGYFTGSDDKRLPELMLDAADLRVRGEETIDGTPCKVIAATTKWGSIVLWIAESKGFIVHRAEFTKGPDDIFGEGGTTVSQEPKLAGLYAGEQLLQWHALLDRVKVSKCGAVLFPVGGRLTETRRLTGGRQYVNVLTCERTKVDLQPKFQGTDAFVSDLQDGKMVTNLDDRDSGITYQLREGKAVPLYGEFTGEVKGSWSPKSKLARALLLGASVLAFLTVASWVVWRRMVRRA